MKQKYTYPIEVLKMLNEARQAEVKQQVLVEALKLGLITWFQYFEAYRNLN